MKKSAQVVMLPTNEKAVIGFLTQKGKERCHLVHFDTPMPNILDSENQHLYFLSDEEIKEGDWVCKGTEIWQVKSYYGFQPITKKIICTTDKSLEVVSKGINPVYEKLPQPSTSFIEKFVEEYNKGNVITEVLVEYEEIQVLKQTLNEGFGSYYHKAESEFVLKVNPTDNTITIRKAKDSWSREEVVELIQKYSKECTGWPWIETDEEWIEENL